MFQKRKIEGKFKKERFSLKFQTGPNAMIIANCLICLSISMRVSVARLLVYNLNGGACHYAITVTLNNQYMEIEQLQNRTYFLRNFSTHCRQQVIIC